MNRRKSIAGTILILIGSLLILAAIGFYAYNLWDDSRANAAADRVLEALEEIIMQASDPSGSASGAGTAPAIPDYVLDPLRDMPAVEIDGRRYVGTISIPALDLELPVLEEWSYPGLKVAPCRYSGTVYQKNMVIAAHNYNAYFGSLVNLKPGDQVVFTDVDGNQFAYQMVLQETLAPTAVAEMTAGEWDLTLFTCTLGGRTRTTVRCTAEPEPES